MTSSVRLARLLPLLALAACGAASAAPAGQPVERSDFSVYELATPWRDAAGQARALASLGGRVQLLAMVYTNCAHTCPQVIAEFKQLEASLTPAERTRVGFVLVSLDPVRDTPAQLARFATNTRLDPAGWTLLTGNDEGVRELAALLGIRYRPEAAGEISHSNSYLVLDAEGDIAHRQAGVGEGVDQPLRVIRALLAAPITH